MQDNSRTYARIGHFHPYHLLQIASESKKNFQLVKKELIRLKYKGSDYCEGVELFREEEEIKELEEILLKETIKVLTFLPAYLESYFFELSAITLGQQYTERYIEKLDLISKIVIVPKLAFGKELNRSAHYWGEIKNLVKWRNKTIHNKTKDANQLFELVRQGKEILEPKPLHEEFKIDSFFNSIEKLFEELDKIDPEGFHLKIMRKFI